MNIKQYKFTYDSWQDIVFEVDLDIFKKEDAKKMLDFAWEYDNTVDPIEELLRKTAIVCLREASYHSNTSVKGIISLLENDGGITHLDGSCGITLVCVDAYEFDEYDLVLGETS